MRKTGNLLIRETTRKSIREPIPALNSATSIQPRNDCKENTDTQARVKQEKKYAFGPAYHESQKELSKAENLTEQEQLQINNEAKRTVTKKVKVSQSKIENDMMTMLEQQCTKLGIELEKEKLQNEKLRSQIQILRKNIHGLNLKLQKTFEDNSCLNKNQQDEKMENKQLAHKLSVYREDMRRKEEEVEELKKEKQNLRLVLGEQVNKLKKTVETLTDENSAIRELKKAIEEQLEEKSNQAEYLRETFKQKKSEWEAAQKQMQVQTKQNLEKKGQKITKAQSDYLKLQQKLKEEQNIRKKLTQKNKQLSAEVSQVLESRKQLEETVSGLKKRINDLSILKSTNNTILNQKIAQLIQDNDKLKTENQELKGTRRPIIEEQRPVLFGSHDFE